MDSHGLVLAVSAQVERGPVPQQDGEPVLPQVVVWRLQICSPEGVIVDRGGVQGPGAPPWMRSVSSTCSSTHGWPDPDLFTSGVSCAPSSHLSQDQVSGPPAWLPSPPAAPPMNMEVKGSYLHIPDQSARPRRSCGGSGGAPAPVCCRSCRSRGFRPPRGHTSSASSSSAPTLHTGGVVTWSAGWRKTVVRIKLLRVCEDV